jgi:biopolymer transport protein ExbB/TolQ
MMGLDNWLSVIRALVSVCPLLGLLGTTTGMVEVYDVMAIRGSGDPRAMADGVSQAMVTTMAGLVVALSGILFSARLENALHKERQRLGSRLHIDENLLDPHHRIRSHKAKERAASAEQRRRDRLARRNRVTQRDPAVD